LNVAPVIITDEANLAADDAIGFEIDIPNYRGLFYKNIFQPEYISQNLVVGFPLASEGDTWLNTDPIEKIELLSPTGTILESSLVSLYGLT